jgi:hypothetical protein
MLPKYVQYVKDRVQYVNKYVKYVTRYVQYVKIHPIRYSKRIG